MVDGAQSEGGGQFCQAERSCQSLKLQKRGPQEDHLWSAQPADVMWFIRNGSLEKRARGQIPGVYCAEAEAGTLPSLLEGATSPVTRKETMGTVGSGSGG